METQCLRGLLSGVQTAFFSVYPLKARGKSSLEILPTKALTPLIRTLPS